MKTSLLILLLSTGFFANAQKGLDEMIGAEKAFAAYSVANNTKDAFLKFMDTGATMFKDGEPYKAYADWLKKEKRPGVLNWWPRYAEVAASGDFGWTAGPWTFQAQTVNDSVVANGYFFTIWKKNDNGEWKFILDVGIDEGQRTNDHSITKLTERKNKGRELDLFSAEERFIKQYSLNTAKAYQDFSADNAVVAAQKTPLQNANDSGIPFTNQKLDFVFKGGGISPAGDLGYAYGTATFNGKKETYLRIWRHEPSGWKIALQMVRL